MSSSIVYGGRETPWREDAAIDPAAPYAREKAHTERMLAAESLPWNALRISAPYGPAQRIRTVLSIFIDRALAGTDLLVHGSGAREQDFTAARDVARAALAALGAGDRSAIINVSGGAPISMLALANLVVASVPGTRSEVRLSGAPDPQDTYRAALDLGRARDELGWRPEVPLARGISEWVATRRAA
jgi:nucleoside-diphosphate-sugar epimerase